MLKKQIQKEESIRIDLQRLLFANESLLNNRSLSSYSINNNTVLHLVMSNDFHIYFYENFNYFFKNQLKVQMLLLEVMDKEIKQINLIFLMVYLLMMMIKH
jgi:hypothetical protein